MLTLLRRYRDIAVYWRKRSAIQRDWYKRHRRVYALNEAYRGVRAAAQTEVDHIRMWSPFGTSVRLETLRICYAISGKQDPAIVPEEIFAADIDRCLNQHEWAPLLSHKSLCARLITASLLPTSHIHRMGGQYFDAELRPIRGAEARELLLNVDYPVVLKPNTGTSGGEGVVFPKSPDELWEHLESIANCTVQEVLKQHPFFAQFNAHGLNTIRLYTYRSVRSNSIHVLNSALRMGRNGSLDNETAGGIVCFLNDAGELNEFALDKYACKTMRHPDSAIKFGPHLIVPQFETLRELACDLTKRVPYAHLIGWDFVLDDRGKWRCIELNLAGHTTRFAQYAGVPFFREFTEEVIAYCLEHPSFHSAGVKTL
jgi:hypothetical protein